MEKRLEIAKNIIMEENEKRGLMRLVYLGVPSDIVMISNKQFLERENDIGHIVYYALKEGLPV